jgi:hypothetical protein
VAASTTTAHAENTSKSDGTVIQPKQKASQVLERFLISITSLYGLIILHKIL